MSSCYDNELLNLPKTYQEALSVDVSRIKDAISGASESSIIGVGSGGSYTVASLLCNLHETYTGRVSRPSTPLEIICNPTLAASSPVFLISAEGKNPDVVEALQRARRHSARTINVLTNRSLCPLIECVENLTDINKHVYELTEKDGYLATNSLLLDAVLIARAYGELDLKPKLLPDIIDKLLLGNMSIDNWVEGARPFVKEVVSRKSLIVIYSPMLSPVAADLESKLSEAALCYCQLADVRSFAHGRHLWLSERADDTTVLALIEPTLQPLWERMSGLIPSDIPVSTMFFKGISPQDLIAGLVAQMKLVSILAQGMGKDPAKPNVLQFGRDLHYLDLKSLIPPPIESSNHSVQTKCNVLGARWPTTVSQGPLTRAMEGFVAALEKQVFRAVVFDYDGTLCSSHRNDLPLPQNIIEQLCRLLNEGVVVGIATGRGGSIQEHLQQALPKEFWPNVPLGLYSGGLFANVGTFIEKTRKTSEFLSHVTRIVRRLKNIGVPIEKIRPTHPFQVSVRFREGVQSAEIWFVIADALRQAGLDLARVVRSNHSVDILEKGVNKAHLIAHIIKNFKIDPYQIITIGDQGAWPGNDTSLLDHRFSLSVNFPSRRLDRGWNLAPLHKRDVDAAMWYMERFQVVRKGSFTINLSEAPKKI